MNFLKKMRSREMIEMSLKTIFALMLGLILIILMEGMIYSIYMNKIDKNTANQYVAEDCVAYCEEISDDEYKIYLHNTASGSWHVKVYNESSTQINNGKYKDVIYRTPNAFDVSIKGSHYVVMAVFIAGILAFYGWRFYKLNKEYANFEKRFKKTGKIF